MASEKIKSILETIERPDIAAEINEKFTIQEQEEMFELLKEILTDEITFVIGEQEKSKNSKGV
jgi:hypothetical protein